MTPAPRSSASASMQTTESPAVMYLLSEGLPPTVVESQVLNYAARLRDRGFHVTIWSLALNASQWALAEERAGELRKRYELDIQVFRGIPQRVPFSRALNSLLLRALFRRHAVKCDVISARTDYAAAMVAPLKSRYRFRLIWDARGDTESELLMKYVTSGHLVRTVARLKAFSIRRWISRARKSCDHALFVSQSLRELQGRGLDDTHCTVIPCLASTEQFFFNEGLRTQERERLRFLPTDRVLVYCGSTAPWQCVPETLELIINALRVSAHSRALIITPDPSAFESLIPDGLRERFHIETRAFSEVNAALNAADLALMIRQPNPVNRVASPVKFAEYALAGLPVLTGNAVEQVTEFGGIIGNIQPPEALTEGRCPPPVSSESRAAMADRARQLYGNHQFDAAVSRIFSYAPPSSGQPGNEYE